MTSTRERFYSLDVARGLAALAVVVTHYLHFFYRGTTLPELAPEQVPLYGVLRPLYTNGGDVAVDFFFVLSGFVFYWLYSSAIAEQRVDAARFALLRFSRLYPLHVITLLLVILGQWAHQTVTGGPFVYGNNDGHHLLLNLAFASGWGMEVGKSFNGPAWSVSVEIFAYLMFFALCRFTKVQWWVLIVVVAIGIAITQQYVQLGRGITGFFSGGLSFVLYRAISSQRKAAHFIAAAALASWAFAFSSSELPRLFILLVAFPLTVVSLALIETARGTLGKRFAIIGDISYGTYMIHFPLQLAIVTAFAALGVSDSVYSSPVFFVASYILLAAIALGSHRYVEIPLQNLIRRAVDFRMTRVRVAVTALLALAIGAPSGVAIWASVASQISFNEKLATCEGGFVIRNNGQFVCLFAATPVATK